jgi:hypothetical protein
VSELELLDDSRIKSLVEEIQLLVGDYLTRLIEIMQLLYDENIIPDQLRGL